VTFLGVIALALLTDWAVRDQDRARTAPWSIRRRHTIQSVTVFERHKRCGPLE